MAQDRKTFQRSLLAAGWRLREGNKHDVFFCPCGAHIVTVSRSPGDKRSFLNVLSQVKKCPNGKDVRW